LSCQQKHINIRIQALSSEQSIEQPDEFLDGFVIQRKSTKTSEPQWDALQTYIEQCHDLRNVPAMEKFLSLTPFILTILLDRINSHPEFGVLTQRYQDMKWGHGLSETIQNYQEFNNKEQSTSLSASDYILKLQSDMQKAVSVCDASTNEWFMHHLCVIIGYATSYTHPLFVNPFNLFSNYRLVVIFHYVKKS
jgi:hypothetical protein